MTDFRLEYVDSTSSSIMIPMVLATATCYPVGDGVYRVDTTAVERAGTLCGFVIYGLLTTPVRGETTSHCDVMRGEFISMADFKIHQGCAPFGKAALTAFDIYMGDA